MKKLASLLALIPSFVFAAVVNKGPIVDNVTHQGCRIVFNSDTSSLTKIGWDTVSHSSFSSVSSSYANHYTYYYNHRIHPAYISGLNAASTYYFKVCADDGTEGCSSEQTLITLPLPSPHPVTPNLPTETIDTTMPTCANGMLNCSGGVPVISTVGANCDSATTGLVALYNAASWGDTIVIPTNTVCTGSYALGSKASWDGTKWMLIKGGGADNLPEGVRVSEASSVYMPTLYQTSFAHLTTTATTTCEPGAYNWNDVPSSAGFYMSKCKVASTVSISSITNPISGYTAGYSPHVEHSSTFSTLPVVGQYCSIAGVQGMPKANGSCVVSSVISSTAQVVDMFSSYGTLMSTPTYTGATMTMYEWGSTYEPYTYFTGTVPTSTCTIGEWAWSDKEPDGTTPLLGNVAVAGNFQNENYGTARVFRCTATNTWTHHYVVTESPSRPGNSSMTLKFTGGHHIRVVGLHFDHPPMPPDPLLYRTSVANNVQGGSVVYPYIWSDPTNNHIILDRCLFKASWPAKLNVMIYMNGDYFGFINNYMAARTGAWFDALDRGGWFDNLASDKISIGFGTGPELIQNNYLEGYGIIIHHNDNSKGSGISQHDSTIKQNYFYENPALIHGTPESTVDYYTPLRQELEYKGGQRVLIDGNRFNGGFRNVSQAAAMHFANPSVSPSSDARCTFSYVGSSMTCTTIGNPANIQVGNAVLFYGDTSYYVITASGTNQFTVPNYPLGGTSNIFSIINSTMGGTFDLTVTNNIFDHTPNIFSGLSHQAHDAGEGETFPYSQDRRKFSNNILYFVGASTSNSYGTYGTENAEWQGSGAGGWHMLQWGGHSDTIYEHNTVYLQQNRPTYEIYATVMTPVDPGDGVGLKKENEGLRMVNNLIWNGANTIQHVGDGGVSGTTVLNNYFTGTSSYTVTKNVVVIPGGDPGTYPGGSKWVEASGATSPFTDPASLNFRLKSLYRGADTCFTTAGDCTTDGADSGVDMTALLAAQGTNFSFGSGVSSAITGNSSIKGNALIK